MRPRELSGRIAVGLVLAVGSVLAVLTCLPDPASTLLLQGFAEWSPLHSTLLVLPLAGLAFVWVERRARAAGGRRIDPRLGWAHLAAGVVIWASGFASLQPGSPVAPEAVIAGLTLLLAHRVFCQLLALRPALGKRLPDRPSLVFFLLPLAVYLTLLPWSTERRPPDGDEPYYLLIAHSLVHDLDADLSDEYRDGDSLAFLDRAIGPQPGDPIGTDGEQYSRHNLVLPLALVPGYWLAGAAGALVTMTLLTAALAWAALRLAARYVPERPGAVLIAWGLFAFGPPLLLYSGQVWVEVPAALLAVLALDRIRRRRERGRPARWGVAGWLPLVALVVLLPLIKIRFLLISASLLLLAWWHSGRRLRPLLVVGGGLAAMAAAVLGYNQTVYGNPLKVHSWTELSFGRYRLADWLEGLVGLFFDGAFGLFAAAPLWLLLVPALAAVFVARRGAVGPAPAPGLRPAAQRGNPALFDLAVLAVPYLGLVAPRSEWYGGWSPPFRYALVLLPLLAIFLVPVLIAGRGGRGSGGARATVAALGALTVALTLVWVAVPGWTYSFADGRGDLFDLASRSLGADAAYWLPSTIRPRPASVWWPLALAVLLPIAWRRPRWLRGARSWGVAAALALVAGGVVAAERAPTRVAELEDPWVAKSGGAVYPEQWITERGRYRGGWTLREGESLVVPVVTGGEGVAIRLEVQFVRNRRAPLDLQVRAGDRLLATWRGRGDRSWSTIDVEPLAWPEGEPLVIAAIGPERWSGGEGRPNGVILDRVDLTWF